jgi:DNA-binding winged helix-turn-helix (wHTH) protein
MYIIDGVIFYDESKNTIWHRDKESESIDLHITASRILLLFIQNKGKVLSREQLLDDIWDKYGITPSSNTLNQYISLLRKSFEKFNFNGELIRTIPKTGFIMPEDISIECVSFFSVDKKRHRGNKRELWFLTTLLFITPFFCLYYYVNDKDTTGSLYFLGDVDECPVYMLYSNSSVTSALKIKSAKKMIDLYASCDGKSMYIYHPSDSFILNGEGPEFITRCKFQNSDNSKFSGCYDVYKY